MLRQLLDDPDSGDNLRSQLGTFIAQLHEKGIYFRSAHLGNVVLTPEGHLGLIDIADMRTYRRPLRKAQRIRNFKHMLRYKEDRAWLLGNANDAFAKAYLAAQTVCSADDLAAALA
jgi:tRNA A-37 threonylcarbamoyl transferase component Bud32